MLLKWGLLKGIKMLLKLHKTLKLSKISSGFAILSRFSETYKIVGEVSEKLAKDF